MDLEFSEFRHGVKVKHKNKQYILKYPGDIWKNYSKSGGDFFIDNLAYLMTVVVPFVSRKNEINYNTNKPLFFNEINEVIRKSIPGAVMDYNHNPKKVIKKFKSFDYNFKNKKIKKPKYNGKKKDKVILSLSFGKDSLLSLGICDELVLDPRLVYINDTVSPHENNMKLNFFRKICKENNFKGNIIINEIEHLNDFENWSMPESCLGYMHMVTSFCFLNLPVAYDHNAGWVVVGNERVLNRTVDYNGKKIYPSFDQSLYWTRKLNDIVNVSSNGKVGVFSVLQSLYDSMLMRVLYKRYPHLAKYQISCPCLDASEYKRWCHDCSTCTTNYLHLVALDEDPKKAGFEENLFEKKYMKFYSLFNGSEIDIYEKIPLRRDEELMLFYQAMHNGAKGKLIDIFKKKYLKEYLEKEDRILRRFNRVYLPKTVPNKFAKKLVSIYKEYV